MALTIYNILIQYIQRHSRFNNRAIIRRRGKETQQKQQNSKNETFQSTVESLQIEVLDISVKHSTNEEITFL